MKFSKTTSCFYPDDIQYADLPGDLIEVSKAEFDQAMSREFGDTLTVVDGALRIVPAPVPSAADVLQKMQEAQVVALSDAYATARCASVLYTSTSGVSKLHQADEASVANLSKMLLAFASTPVPAGFAWLSEDNTPVPFAYEDMQGLAAAIGTQAYAAFVHLQQRKASVRAATTVPAVLAVVW